MKDLLIVSHCILNHAAKVEQDEAELAGEYKIREELLQLVLKKDVQLFQMPCPEFIMYGSQRWGHVKNQFQHPFYIEQYAGDVTGAGWKNNFSGFLPQKCCIKLDR